MVVTSVLLLLLVCLHSSEKVEVPYRAIPDGVTIASDHTDIRGRWRDLVTLPAISSFLAMNRIDAEKFRNEIGWRILIPLVTGDNTVFAFDPCRSADGQPVLYGASFAGWRRAVLQFMLATRWIPGLGRLEVAPGGSKYLPLEGSPLMVSFSMRDNVLLAALSTDGDAVQDLERKLDGSSPVADIFGGGSPYIDARKHLHRFWFNVPDLCENEPVPVCLKIDRLDAGHFSATCDFPADFMADYIGDGAEIVGRNSKSLLMAGDKAIAFSLLPRKTVAGLLNEQFYGVRNAAERKLDREEDAALYLNSDEFGGRFFGFSIPALTVLCPGVVISRDQIERFIARLRAGEKYPQVAETENVGNNALVPLRWQKGNALVKMTPSEYGVIELNRINQGFTFCSARLSYKAQTMRKTRSEPPWKDWLATRIDECHDKRAVAFLWLDMEPLVSTVHEVLSLANFAQRLGLVELNVNERMYLQKSSRLASYWHCSGGIAVLATVPRDGEVSTVSAQIESMPSSSTK